MCADRCLRSCKLEHRQSLIAGQGQQLRLGPVILPAGGGEDRGLFLLADEPEGPSEVSLARGLMKGNYLFDG